MIITLSYGPHGPTSTQDGLWGPTGLKLDWRCLRHNLDLICGVGDILGVLLSVVLASGHAGDPEGGADWSGGVT